MGMLGQYACLPILGNWQQTKEFNQRVNRSWHLSKNTMNVDIYKLDILVKIGCWLEHKEPNEQETRTDTSFFLVWHLMLAQTQMKLGVIRKIRPEICNKNLQ